MSDFETAKELAQHVANIAPRGAVVSYKSNVVMVRLTQQADLHEHSLKVVRNDLHPSLDGPDVDGTHPARAIPGATEPAESVDQAKAASWRPKAPSLHGLSNRVDAHRLLIKVLDQKLKEMDEEITQLFDGMEYKYRQAHARMDRIDEWIEDLSRGLQKQIDGLEARLDALVRASKPDYPMPHYPDLDTSVKHKPEPVKDVLSKRPLTSAPTPTWRRYANELEEAVRTRNAIIAARH